MRVLTALLTAALALLGCADAQLRAHWPYSASRPAADSRHALVDARHSGTVAYSMRYMLTVHVDPGEYEPAGNDGEGGTYYRSPFTGGAMLEWTRSGVRESTEIVPGGIFVSKQGEPSLYWFWRAGDRHPLRIAAPSLRFAVLTREEIQRRRLAREEEERQRATAKQAEERQRAAALAEHERKLAAAREEAERTRAAQQAEAERKRAQVRTELAVASTRNRIPCRDANQCERVFARAQAYILQEADMRIQVATSTLIETYNGTSTGSVSMRLVRVPAAGDAWEVVMTAACREENSQASKDLCALKLLSAYSGFLPYMRDQQR